MNVDSVFTLTDAERWEFAEVAAELSNVPPRLVDDDAWLDAGRVLSCRLPRRLRERAREFRHDAGPDGLLLLSNLPVGDDLPPTPTRAGSVERAATLGASTIVLVSMLLGEPIAYRNEKSGALVQNVVPVPGQEDRQSNAGSTPLEMHVENAFHPGRPDLVALLCLRPDHGRTAGLQIASVRRAVAALPHDTRKVLSELRFATEPPPSFDSPDTMAPRHPVLTGDLDDPDVRVDFHATHPIDDAARDAMNSLLNALLDVEEVLLLEPGALAVVDNRVALHGRTRFRPRYDGEDRWLHRTFIHVDHRRSRGWRSPRGHVLS